VALFLVFGSVQFFDTLIRFVLLLGIYSLYKLHFLAELLQIGLHTLTMDMPVKLFFVVFLLLQSLSSFAQQVIEVKSKIIDLGVVRETIGLSTKKIILKLSSESPEEFKVKFNYKYRFVSQELDALFVGASGNLSFSTHSVSSETYEADSKLVFDISESSAVKGEDLELMVEISKPNQNSHGIKVVVNLIDAKGNIISGGRKLLGLLGRSYKIQEEACQ
jgi:hypothetical protein